MQACVCVWVRARRLVREKKQHELVAQSPNATCSITCGYAVHFVEGFLLRCGCVFVADSTTSLVLVPRVRHIHEQFAVDSEKIHDSKYSSIVYTVVEVPKTLI